MNVFAKFDEIPSKTLRDIKETKRHGHGGGGGGGGGFSCARNVLPLSTKFPLQSLSLFQ